MAKLTEEMVIARTRQSNLAAVVKLNCWGSELSDVSLLRSLVNVEVLSLSVNKISGLSDFQNCHKLQELFVRRNEIRDLNQICYLKHLPKLRILNLAENPCAFGDNYRLTVLHCLPNLEKLDEKQVTAEELRDAMRLNKDLVHPEEQIIVHPEEMICPASPDRFEYLDETYIIASEDEFYTGQNITSTPVSKKPPSEGEYFCKDGTNSVPESQQSSRTNLYYTQSGGLEHDGINGLGSDNGDDDHISSTNRLSVDFSHISPSSSIPLQSSIYKEDNNFPQHRHSMQDDAEEMLPPRLHSLTRSRTVDSVGDVCSRGEIYSLSERSRHPQNSSNKQLCEHPLQRGRQSHNSQFHHRPVTRSSNILNAVLCLVKELDYQGLEVADMAIRCRMDELE